MLLKLCVLMLLTSLSLAQQTFIQNEDGANVGCPDMGPCVASVDEQGRLIPAPVPPSAKSEVTPIAEITVLPTAIPTAFSTPQFANTRAISSLTISNSYDVDVLCDYGTATPAPFTVPANMAYTDNFGARGQKMSSPVRCIRAANTPASGSLKIFADAE